MAKGCLILNKSVSEEIRKKISGSKTGIKASDKEITFWIQLFCSKRRIDQLNWDATKESQQQTLSFLKAIYNKKRDNFDTDIASDILKDVQPRQKSLQDFIHEINLMADILRKRIKRDKNFEKNHVRYIDGKKVDTSVTKISRFLDELSRPDRFVRSITQSNDSINSVSAATGNGFDALGRDFFFHNGKLPKTIYFDGKHNTRIVTSLKTQFNNLVNKTLPQYFRAEDGKPGKHGVDFQVIAFPASKEYDVGGTINVNGKNITYAGAIDLMVVDKNGGVYILDLKTKRKGRSASTDKMLKEQYANQLSLYETTYNSNFPGDIHIKGLFLVEAEVEYEKFDDGLEIPSSISIANSLTPIKSKNWKRILGMDGITTRKELDELRKVTREEFGNSKEIDAIFDLIEEERDKEEAIRKAAEAQKKQEKKEKSNTIQFPDELQDNNKTASFGVEVAVGSSDFWAKVNKWQKDNPSGIIAYRKYGAKTESFSSTVVNDGWIGNPFSINNRDAKTVEQFFDWIVNGNNYDNKNATEEFRQAIINKILATPTNGKIFYYTELNRSSHATVIGYLIKHKELLKQSSKKIEKKKSSTLTVQEDSDSNYASRTKKNAQESDVTIAFAVDFTTAGEKATASAVKTAKKEIVQIQTDPGEYEGEFLMSADDMVNMIYKKLKSIGKTKNVNLNIAGNGIYTLSQHQIVQNEYDDLIYNVLEKLIQKGVTIASIRSGGQTGADEAGIKAAIKLGIPATILAPKGFRFRTADNKDHSNQSDFLARFGTIPDMQVVSDMETVTTLPELFDTEDKSMADLFGVDDFSDLGLDMSDKRTMVCSNTELQEIGNNIMKMAVYYANEMMTDMELVSDVFFEYEDDEIDEIIKLSVEDLLKNHLIDIIEYIKTQHFSTVFNTKNMEYIYGENWEKIIKDKTNFIQDHWNSILSFGFTTLNKLANVSITLNEDKETTIEPNNPIEEGYDEDTQNGLEMEDLEGEDKMMFDIDKRTELRETNMSHILKQRLSTIPETDIWGNQVEDKYGYGLLQFKPLSDVMSFLYEHYHKFNRSKRLIEQLEEDVQYEGNEWLQYIIDFLDEDARNPSRLIKALRTETTYYSNVTTEIEDEFDSAVDQEGTSRSVVYTLSNPLNDKNKYFYLYNNLESNITSLTDAGVQANIARNDSWFMRIIDGVNGDVFHLNADLHEYLKNKVAEIRKEKIDVRSKNLEILEILLPFVGINNIDNYGALYDEDHSIVNKMLDNIQRIYAMSTSKNRQGYIPYSEYFSAVSGFINKYNLANGVKDRVEPTVYDKAMYTTRNLPSFIESLLSDLSGENPDLDFDYFFGVDEDGSGTGYFMKYRTDVSMKDGKPYLFADGRYHFVNSLIQRIYDDWREYPEMSITEASTAASHLRHNVNTSTDGLPYKKQSHVHRLTTMLAHYFAFRHDSKHSRYKKFNTDSWVGTASQAFINLPPMSDKETDESVLMPLHETLNLSDIKSEHLYIENIKDILADLDNGKIDEFKAAEKIKKENNRYYNKLFDEYLLDNNLDKDDVDMFGNPFSDYLISDNASDYQTIKIGRDEVKSHTDYREMKRFKEAIAKRVFEYFNYELDRIKGVLETLTEKPKGDVKNFHIKRSKKTKELEKFFKEYKKSSKDKTQKEWIAELQGLLFTGDGKFQDFLLSSGASFKYCDFMNNTFKNKSMQKEFCKWILGISDANTSLFKEEFTDAFIKDMDKSFEDFMSMCTTDLDSIIPQDYYGFHREMLQEFYYNFFLSSCDIINLTIKDPSFFKDTIDLQKRYAQVHSSGDRVDLDAVITQGENSIGFPVFVDGHEIKASDGFHRTVILKDLNIAPQLASEIKTIFYTLAERQEKSGDKTRAFELRAIGDTLAIEYQNLPDVTDGQSYGSPTTFWKKLAMLGDNIDEFDDVMKEIRQGNYSINNIKTVVNQFKSFIYGFVEKEGHTSFGNEPVPIQIKHSEAMIMLAGAIMTSTDINTPLKALFDFMEKSAYDDATFDDDGYLHTDIEKYNGKGIDGFSFASAVKNGTYDVIDINGLSYTQIMNRLNESIYGNPAEDGYSKTAVKRIPFENWMKQQNVPAHNQDHEQDMGSQSRVFCVSDILGTVTENMDVSVEMSEYNEKTGKYQNSTTTYSAKDVVNLYLNLIAQDMQMGLQDVERELGLHGTHIEKNRKLSKLLQKAVKNDNNCNIELLRAVTLNSKGEFSMPLGDPSMAHKIYKTVLNLIKKKVNKESMMGGPIVQEAPFGFAESLKIKDRKGNVIGEDGFDVKNGVEFEVYITAPTSAMEKDLTYQSGRKLKIKKGRKYKDGDILDIDDALNNGIITEEDLKIIAYRIPTEDKYSCFSCKIKGFLPRQSGEAIIMPRDVTVLSGCDFDIDKMYVMARYGQKQLNGLRRKIESLEKQLNETTSAEEVIQIKDDINRLKRRITRLELKNKIFDFQYALFGDAVNADKLFQAGSFEVLKDIADEVSTSRKAIKSMNICKADTNLKIHQLNAAGKRFVGIAALNNVGHSICSMSGLRLRLPSKVRDFKLNGRWASEVLLDDNGTFKADDVYSPFDGSRISRTLSMFVGAAADNAKEAVLGALNITPTTANLATTMIRMGIPIKTISYIMTQPIVLKLTEEAEIGVASLETNLKKENDNHPSYFLNDEKNELNDSWLGPISRGEAQPTIDQEIIVCKFLYQIQQLSQAYSDINTCTSLNSTKNAVGPEIYDTIAKSEKLKYIIEDSRESDSLFATSLDTLIKDVPFLRALIEPYVTTCEQVFSEFSPLYSRDFQKVLKLFRDRNCINYRFLTGDTIKHIFSEFMRFKATAKEVGLIDTSKEGRLKYISELPLSIKALKIDSGIVNNPMINRLVVRKLNKKSQTLGIQFNSVGMDSELKDIVTSTWNDMLKNPKTRSLCDQIFKYMFFRYGLMWDINNALNLAPNNAKLLQDGYMELLKEDNILDEDIFFNQFIRNNAFENYLLSAWNIWGREADGVIAKGLQKVGTSGDQYFLALDKEYASTIKNSMFAGMRFKKGYTWYCIFGHEIGRYGADGVLGAPVYPVLGSQEYAEYDAEDENVKSVIGDARLDQGKRRNQANEKKGVIGKLLHDDGTSSEDEAKDDIQFSDGSTIHAHILDFYDREMSMDRISKDDVYNIDTHQKSTLEDVYKRMLENKDAKNSDLELFEIISKKIKEIEEKSNKVCS